MISAQRTDDEIREELDAQLACSTITALKQRVTAVGFKYSPLHRLDYFSLRQVVLDPMHLLHLGVVKRVIDDALALLVLQRHGKELDRRVKVVAAALPGTLRVHTLLTKKGSCAVLNLLAGCTGNVFSPLHIQVSHALSRALATGHYSACTFL